MTCPLSPSEAKQRAEIVFSLWKNSYVKIKIQERGKHLFEKFELLT